MKNTAIKLAVLSVITIGATGCHRLSYRYDDDHHHRRGRRAARAARAYAYTHPRHVCSRDCHDHYWDGSQYVSLRRSHHHGHNCGHHWNGKAWLSVRAYNSKGNDYGHHKKYKKHKKYKNKSKGHHDQDYGHGHGNGHNHNNH